MQCYVWSGLLGMDPWKVAMRVEMRVSATVRVLPFLISPIAVLAMLSNIQSRCGGIRKISST